MTAAGRKVLCENTGRALGDAPLEVKLRHLGNCHNGRSRVRGWRRQVIENRLEGAPVEATSDCGGRY